MPYTGAAFTDLLSSVLLVVFAFIEYRCLAHSVFRDVILCICGFHLIFALCSLGGAVSWTNEDFAQPYNSIAVILVMICMGAEGIALIPAGVFLLQHSSLRLEIHRGAWACLPALLGLLHAAFQICARSQYFWSRAVASGVAGGGMCWVALASVVCLWTKPAHEEPETSSSDSGAHSDDIHLQAVAHLQPNSRSIASDDICLPKRSLVIFICSTGVAMVGCALIMLEGDACNGWSGCKYGGPWPVCHNAVLPKQCPFNESFEQHAVLHITWLLAAAGYFGSSCTLHFQGRSLACHRYTVLQSA